MWVRVPKPIMRAAGVLILVGAISACNNQGKTSSKVLVKVNGDGITARQLEAELWGAADKPGAGSPQAVRKQALEALIDRQVLLDQAMHDKIDRDPKVIQIVDRLKTQAIIQAYLESKSSNLANASKAEIDAYYNAHRELFAERKVFDVTQLSVASADFGKPLKAVMDNAVSLDQVAQWLTQHGVDYVRTQRSYTGADLPPAMLSNLKTLNRGRLFVMQDTDGGQDELCVLTDLRDSPVNREAATKQIERYLLNQKMQQVAAAEIARLRASAKLVYADPPPTLIVEEEPGKPKAIVSSLSETR